MRTSLIPHLLNVLTYNLNRKNMNVHVYEVGSIFTSTEKTLTSQPKEREMIAAAVTGIWHEQAWQGEKKAVDFYVVKGILEGLFAELGLSEEIDFVQAQKEELHPGRTANVELAGREIGYIGQVHPATARDNDLRETYVFQLDLEALLNHEVQPVIYKALPRFPAITRDIALVVDSKQTAAEVETIIREAGGTLLTSIRLFDLYEGEHMETGKKSLAFSLTYLDPEQTLTDERVTAVHEKVLAALENKIGASLRE